MIIKDNFLDKDYLNLIQDIIPQLEYELHYSVSPDDCRMLGSVGDPWPRTDILVILAKKIEKLVDCSLIRCYVNLNPAGEIHAGQWHIDDGDITALFMPMPWDAKKYGGNLGFKDGEEIEYKENRLVLFDAKRPHRAMPHTFEGFRYTIAFKMQKNIT